MKYLYPLSLLLFLASCQKEEKKELDHTKTDWAFYKLEGNVKSLSTKSWLVNGKLEKIKNQHEDMSAHDSDMLFDENGLLTSEKFTLNNKPFEEGTYLGREKKQSALQYIGNVPGIKTEYSWDKSGKHNTAITRRNTDNTQIDRIEMQYQGDNMAQKTTFNAQNIITDKLAYHYDNKGNVIQEDIYLGTEAIQYKSILKYDKKNRKTSDARYDKNSKKLHESKLTYEGDNLIKKYITNEKGIVQYAEDFTYDAKGRELTHLTYDRFDDSKTLDTYSYDEKGNKLAWSVTKNDIPFMKATYAYDSKNNNTLVSVTDATGKEVDKREYTYEYDKKGNWIKRTVKINGVPQFIAERQITYFDEE